MTSQHSLFDRGLDFIEKSIDALLSTKRTFDDVAYVVLYFWTGTELLLKQALMEEHWSLIFGQVESANQEALKSGAFISVDFNTAIKRLRGICGVKINEDEYKFLDSVYAQRNKLMHYGKLDSHDSVISLIAKALDFLCNKFCHEALPNEDCSRMKALAHELEEYIEAVWNRINPDIENARKAGNC